MKAYVSLIKKKINKKQHVHYKGWYASHSGWNLKPETIKSSDWVRKRQNRRSTSQNKERHKNGWKQRKNCHKKRKRSISALAWRREEHALYRRGRVVLNTPIWIVLHHCDRATEEACHVVAFISWCVMEAVRFNHWNFSAWGQQQHCDGNHN